MPEPQRLLDRATLRPGATTTTEQNQLHKISAHWWARKGRDWATVRQQAEKARLKLEADEEERATGGEGRYG